jgi:hypothetical protein
MIRLCAPLFENEPETGGVHPDNIELRLPLTNRLVRRRGDVWTTIRVAVSSRIASASRIPS